MKFVTLSMSFFTPLGRDTPGKPRDGASAPPEHGLDNSEKEHPFLFQVPLPAEGCNEGGS